MTKILANLRKISLFLSICFFFFSYWLYFNFGKVTLDQLNSVLNFQFWSISSDTRFGFIKWVLILPSGIATLLWGGEFFKTKWAYSGLISGILLLCGIFLFSLKVNTDFFSPKATIQDRQKSNFFSAYKTPPLTTNTNGKSPSNVIWIFVESLEKDYQDERILDRLHKATAFMNQLEVSPLINKFTIGGVLSAKCGAPLFLKSFLNQNSLSSSGFSNA